MKYLILPLIVIFAACSSGTPSPTASEHTAQHGGTILKGKDHYVEVVATENYLKIYPLEASGNTLVPVPVEKVKGDAKYSMVRSKSDWKVDLESKTDALEGRIDAKGEKEVAVKLDMKIDGEKESFFHNIPVQ